MEHLSSSIDRSHDRPHDRPHDRFYKPRPLEEKLTQLQEEISHLRASTEYHDQTFNHVLDLIEGMQRQQIEARQPENPATVADLNQLYEAIEKLNVHLVQASILAKRPIKLPRWHIGVAVLLVSLLGVGIWQINHHMEKAYARINNLEIKVDRLLK